MTDEPVVVPELKDIQQTASEYLKSIMLQEHHVKTFQSNVGTLLKKYHIERSYVDSIALWYGERSWWSKAGLWGLVLGGAAGVGFVLNLLVALPIVMFALYGVLIMFLSNHYTVLQNKDASLTKDITQLETSLAGSVEHLEEVEKNLKSVFASLFDLNMQQADNAIMFKAEVDKLEQQVELLSAFSESAQAATYAVTQNSAVIAKAARHIEQEGEALTEEVVRLHQTQDRLNNTMDSLLNQELTLDTVKVEFHQSHQELLQLSKALKGLIAQMRAYHNTSTQPKETPSPTTKTSQILQSANTLLQQFDEKERQRELAVKRQTRQALQDHDDTEQLLKQAKEVRQMVPVNYFSPNILAQ